MTNVLPAEQVEIPDMCFNAQGEVACFLCDGPRWPTVLVPATRDAEAVLAAWSRHAAESRIGLKPSLVTSSPAPEHDPDRPVLATLTSPTHAWQWPAS